jgi:hypothetical protein
MPRREGGLRGRVEARGEPATEEVAIDLCHHTVYAVATGLALSEQPDVTDLARVPSARAWPRTSAQRLRAVA